MEEKTQPKIALPRLLVTARPAKKAKKRKTEAEKTTTKKNAEKARSKSRVNIGLAFERWRQLRELKGLESDAKVAVFLLDRYVFVFWGISFFHEISSHRSYLCSHIHIANVSVPVDLG